jgi:hypothetical protein
MERIAMSQAERDWLDWLNRSTPEETRAFAVNQERRDLEAETSGSPHWTPKFSQETALSVARCTLKPRGG